MVLKTTLCRFSGLRIYPGKGLVFIRVDGQQFIFMNKKCRSLFHNKLKAAKLSWTAIYRKQHKKDQITEVQRKKRRNAGKSANRSVAGLSLELINKKRTEKPEVRQASREAAIREIKERAKKLKAERAKQSQSNVGAKAAPKVVGRGKR